MPTNNNHINYTAEDLLRYAQGNMPAQERHALEKAALEDPFLSEAIDGYLSMANADASIDNNSMGNAKLENSTVDGITELNDLRKIIADKAADKKEEKLVLVVSILRNRWLQTAVAALFIMGAAWWLYSISNKPKEIIVANNVAINNKITDVQPPLYVRDSAISNVSKPVQPTVVDNVAVKKAKVDVRQNKPLVNGLVANNATLSSRTPGAEIQTDSVSSTKDKDVAKLDETPVRAPAPAAEAKAKSQNELNDVVVIGYGTQRKTELNSLRKANVTNPLPYVFKGRILDDNNNPLPYSSVMVPGENFGTYSDSRGYFNFVYTDSVLPIRAKSFGFETQNINLHAYAKENHIVMNEDKNIEKSIITFKRLRQTNNKPMMPQIDSIGSFAEPNIGWNNYDLYLTNNNRISDLQLNDRTVQLSFEIDRNGDAKNITIEKSQGKDLDTEAIRLIKEGPKWKPKVGDRKGKVVVKF